MLIQRVLSELLPGRRHQTLFMHTLSPLCNCEMLSLLNLMRLHPVVSALCNTMPFMSFSKLNPLRQHHLLVLCCRSWSDAVLCFHQLADKVERKLLSKQGKTNFFKRSTPAQQQQPQQKGSTNRMQRLQQPWLDDAEAATAKQQERVSCLRARISQLDQ